MKVVRLQAGWDHEVDHEGDGVALVGSEDEIHALLQAAGQNRTLSEEQLADAQDEALRAWRELWCDCMRPTARGEHCFACDKPIKVLEVSP